MLESFFGEQQQLLKRVSSKRRYLYGQIDWSLPSIGVVGARGVGKTTLMLQRIKEYGVGSSKALYVSADHPYFQGEDL